MHIIDYNLRIAGGKQLSIDTATTSVAPRQRPKANIPGKPGILPTPPTQTTLNMALPNPKTTQPISHFDDSIALASRTAIDNAQPQSSLSTNPFSQPSVSGLSTQLQHQPSSDTNISNPFVTTPQAGMLCHFMLAFFGNNLLILDDNL